jgi:isoquinoline 1-oxidoreductase subunit beta
MPQVMRRGLDHFTYKIADWMHLQVTGGSGSIRFTGEYGMRAAGAGAKHMLLEAAAAKWQVPVSECRALASKIVHATSGKSATFGELANDAAQLDPPARPQLKERTAFTIVGTSRPRFDIPSKVNGTATFGIDVVIPDMLYAAIEAAPTLDGKLRSFERSIVEKMPGVIRVVELNNAVAVVADGYWRAGQALKQLRPTFDVGTNADASTATTFQRFADILNGDRGNQIVDRGNVDDHEKKAAKVVDAEYRVPYLAHITMEPMNATARVADGRCEVWTGTQDPLSARDVAAKAAELDADMTTIHNQQLGGGFGRRLPGTLDYVEQAVRVAKAMSPRPVKLIWSREEDFRHDFYRQASVGRYRAALDSKGRPLTWRAHFIGSAGEHSAEVAYAIPNVSARSYDGEHAVRLGAWRSVDHTQHGFYTESFIDELAHAAGRDPFEYRRELLADKPRHLAVLESAAANANWGSSLPAGKGRGIALVESFGSVVCEVAEVEVDPRSGTKRVTRVVAVVDCGEVVNPDSGAAQIEGGIVFGLAAALYGAIDIEKGAVVQSNFDNHPVARMADAPKIEVHFVASQARRGGLGEPGVPPIAPAVANAIFAATGERVRSLPIAGREEKSAVSGH